MPLHSNSSNSETQSPEKNHSEVLSSVKNTGLTAESIEHVIKSPSAMANESLHALHQSASVTRSLHHLGSVAKLLDVVEMHEINSELLSQGHSRLASFLGAGAGVASSSAVFLGGAGLMAAGVLAAPEAPPVGVTAMATGVLLMRRSEEAGKAAKHHVPILVDATLDKFSELYSSAAQFVQQSYQKWMGQPEYQQRSYADIESVMLSMGYKEFVSNFYSQLDQQQQLIYGKVTRDLFNEQFQLNANQKVTAAKPVVFSGTKDSINPTALKKEINEVQTRLAKETELLDKKNAGQLHSLMKKSNEELNTNLKTCVAEANRMPPTARAKVAVAPQVKSCVQNAHQFCEVYHVASQGVALVAHIAGNHRVAQQVAASAMGVTQVVMGIANIAQNGWALGPVGMVLGGMNALISCFGSDNSGAAMEALAEQLAAISRQIHALHEDMLIQFGKVFTALGIINTNIIEGFKLLHKDQEKMLEQLVQLQKSMVMLQDSVNSVGKKVDGLSADLQGYILEGDRKQLQFVLNGVREKIRRDFVRVDVQTQVMSAFKTYNEEVVMRQLNGEKPTSAVIARNLTTKLGSAEANTGLLLNYAKNVLGLRVKQPIADPEQWRQCANLLIEMTDINANEKQDYAVGVADYEDFKHLNKIGENWLDLIGQFKNSAGQENNLSQLFNTYRAALRQLNKLIDEKIQTLGQENKEQLSPPFRGLEEWTKQHAFKFELKRNYWYCSLLADSSGCKGFNNPIRFYGDNYAGEWNVHVAGRQKEISEQLEQYKSVVVQEKKQYEAHSNFFKLYPADNKLNSLCSAPSVFMRHEKTPDKMPLLPLPIKFKGVMGTDRLSYYKIPEVFLKAERLNLGKIQYTYRYEKNEFIYSVQLQLNDEKTPLLVQEYRIQCVLPDYLNPEEAAWHAYMGGTYPVNGGYSNVLRHSGSPNGDYFFAWYCATPSISTTKGLRDTLVLDNIRSSRAASKTDYQKVEETINQKLRAMRLVANKKIIQELESVDNSNPLAKALLEVDASAKMLISFVSILFRTNYQFPAAVWTAEDILNYAKGYTGHDVYVHHQLCTHLDVLNAVESVLREQIQAQTESAYTPVNHTLKKLREFMRMYEAHVEDDRELAAKERMQQSSDAMMFGAVQTALLLQSELIQSGHMDAAAHLSKLFTQVGLNRLTAPPQANSSSARTYAPNSFFSGARNRLVNQSEPSMPGPLKITSFKIANVQLTRQLYDADRPSAESYIEIPSFADNNCCFNTVALSLIDLIQSDKNVNEEGIRLLIKAIINSKLIMASRISECQNELSPLIVPLKLFIEFVNTNPSPQDFKNYIKNPRQQDQNSIVALHLALAPALRQLGSEHHLDRVLSAQIGEDEVNDALKLKQDRAWAGHEVIHALASIFKVNIDIKHNKEGDQPTSFRTATAINQQMPINPAYPTVTLLNLREAHWNYLIPTSQQNGLAASLPKTEQILALGMVDDLFSCKG